MGRKVVLKQDAPGDHAGQHPARWRVRLRDPPSVAPGRTVNSILYVGWDQARERVRDNLRVLIAAAKDRHETLDHVLFSGPPGLGRPRLPMWLPTRWAPGCEPRRGRLSLARETLPPYSPTSRRATSSLWTRYTASTTRSRVLYPQWRTSSSTLSLARVRQRAPSVLTFRISRSLVQPRAYRASHGTLARPLWHLIPPGLLHRRRAQAHCPAFGGHPWRPD